jgi:hypothetical protein
VRAALVGLGVGVAGLLVYLVPLWLAFGFRIPDVATWDVGEQMSYGQVVGTFLAVALAGGFGWYAVEQLRLARAALGLDLDAREAIRREELLRLTHGLQAMIDSIDRDQHVIAAIKAAIEANHITLLPSLETFTWDAVKPEIVPFLHDGHLAAQLARYVEWTTLLRRLSETYSDLVIGAPAALSGTARYRPAVRGELLKGLDEATGQAVRVRKSLRDALDRCDVQLNGVQPAAQLPNQMEG